MKCTMVDMEKIWNRYIIRVKTKRVLLYACCPPLHSDALTRKFMNDKPQTLQHHNSVKIARGDERTFGIFPTHYIQVAI